MDFLGFLELFIGVLFIVEYLLRFWTRDDRVRFVFSVYSLIDLAAILPVFLAFSNLQFLKVFRLFRVFRFLRFLEDRHFFFGEITDAMLIGFRIFFIIFTIIFVSAGLMHSVERGSNQQVNTFMDAAYFSIVTLTTVGFGDIVPVTQSGRFITILIIVSGIVFIPWQVGRFVRELLATSGKTHAVCGECGLTHHDVDAVHCKHCGSIIYQETGGG